VSSRRRLRRRSRAGKRRYPTGGLAAKAAAAIQARRPPALSGSPLRAYPCPFCAGWHIGHRRPPDPHDPQGACP
jgi:hypothetical protein